MAAQPDDDHLGIESFRVPHDGRGRGTVSDVERPSAVTRLRGELLSELPFEPLRLRLEEVGR